MGIGNEGEDDEKNEEESQPELDETGREDLFILDVILFEIAAAHNALTYFILLKFRIPKSLPAARQAHSEFD
jgi:hypothetical protein